MEFTKGERFIIDWQYGRDSDFKTLLRQTIAKADDLNLERLCKGFPDEVVAWYNYKNTKGWWDKLEKRAKEKDILSSDS